MTRRVAVIGAGCSGLACIKCCLDEGLVPVCFESGDDIGGMWRYKERPEPDHCSIYRSLITNTSKEFMCFSDFPMPDHYPNYLHHSQLLQYLRLYAAHFDLLRHIRFQTTVCCVKEGPQFSHSGQWEVETKNGVGDKERHIFDAVLVCTGHFTRPAMPLEDFPGVETFEGKCYHSWEYRHPDALQGKRVVVVGIGNSGGDIAVEISRAARKTFLSTRQGAWVIGRMSDGGLPVDMTMITRCRSLLMHFLPKALVHWAGERGLNQKYDHRLYGLLPKHRLLEGRTLINDDLPGRILSGALVMKPHLQGFRGSSVVFEDGTVEDQIEAVVFCTGYNYSFPFLPSSLFQGHGHELTLYHHVFSPTLKHPTLAIMGLVSARGPFMPVVEMQARWATRVFTGLNQLPPKKTMLNMIETERKRFLKSYPCPKLAAVQVDYITYMDELAKEVGVRPNFLGLLLRDPRLGLSVLLGPCTPYQYRLRGPGRWAGARQAILTQWERVAKPMKTRPVPEPRPSAAPLLLTVSCAALLLTAVYSQRKTPAVLLDPAAVLNRLCSLPGIMWKMCPCLKL
ncbi:flavin-containing monooxygenase 5-like [Anguilla anguilla]|uniref:flavin-containing monooxygenase 5-like n=1 Tax=Anguilla anguilla TaxID=7936 RepID=UPI0015A8019A|nr:flavin-containing monooxygenase 5-like [Anguilla anguilla]XP_035270372.1 flavin-containing monooxygenase 5-like [Anguilla anguilla]XP_035270373.1 flavin-containing monooxygenase 5-like [Anguilla anguilla]XP_035270374.1 flavin-containing monooxygenase 5-like [Anguilla anguilla]